MNVHPLARDAAPGAASAHPLYSPEQAFLWLPGLPGEEQPFCSYNAAPRKPKDAKEGRDEEPARDANGAPLVPPYSVSQETFIAWDTRHQPHFPYHPLPIARTLSTDEFTDLGNRVTDILGYSEDAPLRPTPLEVLKDENKEEILAALSEMGLLSRKGFPALHAVD